jgi:hypothetical protein
MHGPVFLLYQKGRDSFQAQDRAIDGRHKGSTALISFTESPISGVYRPEFFPSARAENRVGCPYSLFWHNARMARPKTVRRRNRSPSWASAMTYRPRFLPELWLCRAAPLARSRRRRARPCVELLHNLRAGQPRADRPQPGGPAGVHDADRQEFMTQTGYPHGRPGYVVDHIIPLKRGGADAPWNMWRRTRRSDRRARDSGDNRVLLFL